MLACRPQESSGGLVYGGTPSYYDGQLWPNAHLSAAAGRRQSRGFWLKTQRKEIITDWGLSKPDTPCLSKLRQEVTRFSVKAFVSKVGVCASCMY